MQEAVEATKAAEKLMVESVVYESPRPGEKEKEEEEEAKWETLSNHINIPYNVFVQRECVIFTPMSFGHVLKITSIFYTQNAFCMCFYSCLR